MGGTEQTYASLFNNLQKGDLISEKIRPQFDNYLLCKLLKISIKYETYSGKGPVGHIAHTNFHTAFFQQIITQRRGIFSHLKYMCLYPIDN